MPIAIPEMNLLTQLVVLFLLSIAVNLVCTRFKLPTTVGFLLTGALCGPSVLGIVNNKEAIDEIAELGVSMLMFTIGVELSGDALSRLKKPVFVGGTLQIGLIVAAAGAVGAYVDHMQTGILLGCLAALSSSAIVLQIFQEKSISPTPVGRLGLAILVFQDIMAAPMVIAIPLLAGQAELTVQSVITACVKVGGLGLGLVFFSRVILNRLMDAVVRTRASEVLLLTTLCLCLGMASVTSALGMSASLGAFLAGLMLARSRYAMSVMCDILPYKNVFMSLFFISVGMMLDVAFIWQNWWQILLVMTAFIIVKAIFGLPSVLLQGYPLRTALITSLSLAQVGEFSFVLAASGLACGLMRDAGYQSFLAISVMTMMLTPVLISLAPSLSDGICRLIQSCGIRLDDGEPEEGGNSAPELSGHVIISGYGVCGRYLASSAKNLGIPYNIVEMNPETVARYQKREPISYGDASQEGILEGLGIHRATVLAIVISDPVAVRAITAQARTMNPEIVIIARARYAGEVASIRELGASVVISEEFESSVEIVNQVLVSCLVPREDVDRQTALIRASNNRSLRRQLIRSGNINSLGMTGLGVQAFRISPTSPLCGRTLATSEIRPRFGAMVVAIARGTEYVPSPRASFPLLVGDVLYLFGRDTQLNRARDYITGE